MLRCRECRVETIISERSLPIPRRVFGRPDRVGSWCSSMVSAADAKLVPLEQTELIVRLRWFIHLRWLFGAAALLAGAALSYAPLGRVQGRQVVLVALGLLAYNWLFWLLERWLAHKHPETHARRAALAASAQIILDLIGLTLILHATGGIENPFCIFYVFHMVIATLLLRVRDVFSLAGLAIVLFTSLTVAEMKDWLPHNSLFDHGDQYKDLQFVGVNLVAFSSALLIAVYLGTSVARTLRSREREILWLERELASYALELERTNEELREADQAKTQYFRKVSHDLKSPLAAQQSLLRALLIEMRDMKPESRTRVERAIARGDGLLALLDDLLLLSKARDIGHRSRHEWIDPGDRLRPVLDTQSVAAHEKGLNWFEDMEKPLPAICAEPGLLPALAENLLSNAIKYTPPGGTVTFSLRGEDEHLIMTVRDTGIGVAKEDLANIGQQFFRTKQARESGSTGTGLGMTIVRSMVEAMRGRFQFESELGRGTAVTISLPLAHPDLLKEVEPFCRLPSDRPAG
jgi:signal transduction histidine kinase